MREYTLHWQAGRQAENKDPTVYVPLNTEREREISNQKMSDELKSHVIVC